MCSLFLCLLLCLANFSVVANAAEAENLVDSNLSNWTDYSDENEYFESPNISYLDNNVNYIEVSGSSYPVYIFDVTEFLKIGESYNFSFNLPTTGGSNSTSLNSCELHWCLTDGNGDSVPSYGSDVFEIVVNNNNKSNYLGKTTVFEFTYTQGFQNTFLCLSIIPADNLEAYNDLELYISDISLERVTTESEKKLDGILGWLEDIKNSITGLGDKLTSVWENIISSVSALGDRISGFFSDLGNTISTKFNELTTNFSNFITNLGDRISEFFDNLITNVKTFFEELPRKIFNYEIEVTDDDIISDGEGSEGGEDDSGSSPINLFSDLQFETTGALNVVDYGDYYYVEFPQKTSSGLAYKKQRSVGVPIESEVNYLFSFDVSQYHIYNDCYILIESSYHSEKVSITGEGSYSVEFPSSPVPDTVYITLAVYSRAQAYYNLYDLSLTAINASGDDTGSGDEGTTTKVSWFQYLINKFKSWFNSIIDSVKGFFIKLVDDIKGLFIPADGFFEEWKVTFDLMLSDNLGFIYQAPNFVIDIVEVVQEILQSDQEVNLVFPAVEFDIAGYHIELFKDTKVDFSFLEAGIWLTLYSMYKVMLYVIFALALIKYGMSTWERTMAN